MKLDGGDPVRLTTNPGGDFFPAWSPDDRQILFHSSRTGNRELFSMSADGTGEQQLTTEKMELYAPQLSPDGRHLYAYAGSGAGAGRPRYDVVFDKDAAGRWTNMRRVTPDHPSVWFRLSHDGQWIAYVSAVPDAPPGNWTSAMAVRTDGKEDHVVLDMMPAEQATFAAFGKDAGTLFVMTRRAACAMMPRTGSAGGISRRMGGGCSLRSRRTRATCT
ncbi:MAG: tolB protein precursor protein [Gemmatimonadetes bacterium]|nr:tolB protein precursor protein [Gemmatimonadota bacterium]